MARKPTSSQLLSLRGLRDQLALGGKVVNAHSPFWSPFRRRHWVSDDGRVTPAGETVLRRYVSVMLRCDFCETRVADYVAELGVRKVLRRKCPCCDLQRAYVVTGSDYEVTGARE